MGKICWSFPKRGWSGGDDTYPTPTPPAVLFTNLICTLSSPCLLRPSLAPLPYPSVRKYFDWTLPSYILTKADRWWENYGWIKVSFPKKLQWVSRYVFSRLSCFRGCLIKGHFEESSKIEIHVDLCLYCIDTMDKFDTASTASDNAMKCYSMNLRGTSTPRRKIATGPMMNLTTPRMFWVNPKIRYMRALKNLEKTNMPFLPRSLCSMSMNQILWISTQGSSSCLQPGKPSPRSRGQVWRLCSKDSGTSACWVMETVHYSWMLILSAFCQWWITSMTTRSRLLTVH